MTHQAGTSLNPLSSLEQLERQTVQGTRLIRDNIHSVLRPLVQSRSETYLINNGMTLSNWIQGRAANAINIPSTSERSDEDSFVINMEEVDGARGSRSVPDLHQHTGIPLDSALGSPTTSALSSAPPNNTPPNQSNAEDSPDTFNIIAVPPEMAVCIDILRTYFPYMVILICKAVYDFFPGILLFVGLTGTFIFHNRRLKQEIALNSQKNVGFLVFSIVQLVLTSVFYCYLYSDLKLYLSLLFIPPYAQPLSVADLLWLIGGNDYILRFVTIIVKILITLIPHRVFPAKRRGKWYVMVETTSQVYRSLVPIQPWLYYLLESYEGPQKVIGVFLSATYMVAKGSDLMLRALAWWRSFFKLLEGVQLGLVPTKDQLNNVGPTCPICHDTFNTPVVLSCRHIFCEDCVSRWFNSEQTCPMCRAKVIDDPSWRDGSTTFFIQLF